MRGRQSTVQSIRLRFSIRHLMIAVAIVACVLVLLKTYWDDLEIDLVRKFFVPLCVVWGPTQAVLCWRLVRHRRGRSAWCFGIVSFVTSAFLALWTIHAPNIAGSLGLSLAVLFGVPAILGCGVGWARAATSDAAAVRRSPKLAWSLVIALAGLPITMLVSPWPFYLAFLASKPVMERLANQVTAGGSPRFPCRAGFFRVAGSTVEPRGGNIGLIANPDPLLRTGFVRVNRVAGPRDRRMGPFYPSFELYMGDGWWYQAEDQSGIQKCR